MTRDVKLARAYASGKSMRECAAEFGISLERVRQILRKHWPEIIRRSGDTSQHSSGLHARIRSRLLAACGIKE